MNVVMDTEQMTIHTCSKAGLAY